MTEVLNNPNLQSRIITDSYADQYQKNQQNLSNQYNQQGTTYNQPTVQTNMTSTNYPKNTPVVQSGPVQTTTTTTTKTYKNGQLVNQETDGNKIVQGGNTYQMVQGGNTNQMVQGGKTNQIVHGGNYQLQGGNYQSGNLYQTHGGY